MSDTKYKKICQTCSSEKFVTARMMRLVERGEGLNCLSCANKGNTKRYLGKIYDKSYYQTSIYNSWSGMKRRCLNTSNPSYKNYGGRGITVCDKWLTFSGFLDDMGSTHQVGLSIERLDNNGSYEKSNCIWSTPKGQANNTRNIERASKYYDNGKLKTIKQLAEEYGIKKTTLSMRLKHYKWPLERALK